MTDINNINPKDVQRFVRSRVDASYNKQLFDEQLNDQIQKNLYKMQQSIIKEMKRKMIIKNKQQIELQKRQNMKKIIQQKLIKSKQKRQSERRTKQKNKSLQKSQRKKLYQQRISKLRSQEKQKIEEKLKQFQQKQILAGPSYNKISSAVSLIEQPHYKRKLQNQQSQYTRLKKMVEQKNAFKAPDIKARQLSMTELKPRQRRDKTQQQKINKMGQHLQKIQESRRKKQKINNQKSKNMKLIEQQSAKMRAQRLKLLLQAQKQRQQNIIAKLSKSSLYNSSIQPSGSESSKVNKKSDRYLNDSRKGSVLYEQGQQRQKYTFRKQIKEQIKQYMIKQKQKYLFAQ